MGQCSSNQYVAEFSDSNKFREESKTIAIYDDETKSTYTSYSSTLETISENGESNETFQSNAEYFLINPSERFLSRSTHLNASKETVACTPTITLKQNANTTKNTHLEIKDILKYKQMRSAFIAFLIEQTDELDLSYLQGSQSLLLTDTDSHVMSARTMAYEYLKYSAGSDDDTLNKIEASCEENAMFEIFQSLESIQVDLVAIITIRSFYDFLKNESWKKDCRSPIVSPPGSSRIEWVQHSQPICYFDNSMNLDAKIKSVYDCCVLDEYLVSRSLLSTLIMALKYIPVAISIISIDKSVHTGDEFPIIYVNEQFETETGFNKDAIVNKDKNYFLSYSKTEPKTMAEMKRSLEYGRPMKFELKTLNTNGKLNRNFVAFKPVFDQHNEKRYMFSCMYDIDSPDSSLAKVKLMDQVLSLLPEIIMFEESELKNSSIVPLSMV